MRKKTIIILTIILFLTIPMLHGLKWTTNPSKCFTDNNIRITSTELYNFTLGMYQAPNKLDPIDCYERTNMDVIRQVAETLWFYNWSDPDLPRINMLAKNETWKNSTALEVTLRQGVTFHDGTPFNASVVDWNIDRMMYLFNHTGALAPGEHIGDPHIIFEFPNGSAILADFEVTGTYKGIIHLAHPFSSLMDLFCFTAASMISPTAHAGKATSFIDISTDDLVGTGPYMYDYYITDTEVKFSRWDNYWREPVLFENMVYEIFFDMVTGNYMMLNGDFDYLTRIHPTLVDTFIADPNIIYDASNIPGFTYFYLVLNNKQINITWRKAMSYAFNYTDMIKNYYQDKNFRSYGPISSGFSDWYTSDVEALAPYLNLTIARQTLIDDPGIDTTGLTANDDPNDAAWLTADLATFNYSYPTNNYREDLYEKLDNWFDRIGITVIDGGTDWSYFSNRAFGYLPGGYDDLQMFWTGWAPDYLDPINMIQPIFSNESNSNAAQVNDTKLEAMILQFLSVTDLALKVEIINNISKYIASELYAHIYIHHPMTETCISTGIFDVSYDLNRYTFYAYPIKPSLPFYPNISSSGDKLFLEGEAGHEIIWNLNASDLYAPIYSVYQDTTHLITNPWGFDAFINISLDGLSIGQYSYKIEVQNGPYSIENYVNVEVAARLEISHPSDIIYPQGDTGNVISWVVNEGYEQNAMYYIYNESDILVDSNTWDLGIPITFNMDGLSVGTHTYRIEIHNLLEFVEDNVTVNVVPKLSISHPPDINYTQGDTGNVISWVVSEGYEQNATYYIYDESDVLIQSDSWEINVPISLNVDGLSVGTHTFRIEVHNTLEYVEDTVGVVVEAQSQAIPGFSILFLLSIALISVVYIGLKSKYKQN